MRVPLLGSLAGSSATMSMLKGAGTVTEALDDVADEQYSRVESVVSVEKAPDPASGGDDAGNDTTGACRFSEVVDSNRKQNPKSQRSPN